MSRESTWVGGDSQWDLHNGLHTHMHYIATLYCWNLIYYNTITIYKFLFLFDRLICHKSPLSPTLFCVSVDTQRAPGARMYIAIYIRRQFWKKAIPTEAKRKQEKQLQGIFVHIWLFSLIFILLLPLLFIICFHFIFQRKMWIPWSGQSLSLARNVNSISPPF